MFEHLVIAATFYLKIEESTKLQACFVCCDYALPDLSMESMIFFNFPEPFYGIIQESFYMAKRQHKSVIWPACPMVAKNVVTGAVWCNVIAFM